MNDTSQTPKASGQRRGKRTGVRQYSVYLSEKVHRAAKIVLLVQGSNLDFSGLVEQLLVDYLAKNKAPGAVMSAHTTNLEK